MAYRSHEFDQEMVDPGITPTGTHAPKKRIKLALQGGGAYGAYTAGVLIQLLLDPQIEIVEISGTSAGEKTALIVADRINSAATYDEGRQAAVHGLLDFWGRIVKESAPVMHALDVMDKPFAPDNWSRLMHSAGSPNASLAVTNVFRFWRAVMPANPFYQQALDAMESPWRHNAASPGIRRASANLPALEHMTRQQRHMSDSFAAASRAMPVSMSMLGIDAAVGSIQSATTAVATEAIRRIIGQVCTTAPDPRDPQDRIFTHAASGKFVKVHINTAMQKPDGTLENCVHTGGDITLKRSMGSSALMGFFEPAIINGRKHWDGGYTENTSLRALKDSDVACDAIFVIGTNRPVDTKITPRLQSDIPRGALMRETRGLVLHQMYDEAVYHAENWKKGEPTWHIVTYNHAPDADWTAKQNTSDWHINEMIRHGQSDAVAAIIEARPFFGVAPTIKRETLEAIAKSDLAHKPDGTSPRTRATRAPLSTLQAA